MMLFLKTMLGMGVLICSYCYCLAQPFERAGTEHPPLLTRRVTTPTGKVVIFNIVEPPARSPAPLVSPQSKALAEVPMESAGCLTKVHLGLIVSGTAYANGMTIFSWSYGGQQYRAFSNADFSLLDPIVSVEDERTVYTVMPLISKSSATPNWLTEMSSFFDLNHAQYLVSQENSDNVVYEGIDALHQFYETNKVALTTAKIAALEASQRAPASIDQKENVINFWFKSNE